MSSRILTRRWNVMGDDVIHRRETSATATGSDRPLVLLHGVGTTSRYCRPVSRELQGRVPATAVELPGIGASSSARIPGDVAAQADVVAGWMRSTGRRTPLVPASILLVRGEHVPLAPRRWLREPATAARSSRVSQVAGGAHACHHGRPVVVADMLVAEHDRLGSRLASRAHGVANAVTPPR